MTVTVNDVERKLGRTFESSEFLRVQSDIDDAYALVELYGVFPDSETAAHFTVIRRVVLRAFRNPEGSRQVQQESLGSRSVSYAEGDGSPGVYFTAQDIRDLRGRRSSTYSIRLTTPAGYA